MEYLQYLGLQYPISNENMGFKPCYKWNTFNTYQNGKSIFEKSEVLNLVISGIPSILYLAFDAYILYK